MLDTRNAHEPQLRVSDLGWDARFIRSGRLGMDVTASFVFSSTVLIAIFFMFFLIVFWLSVAGERLAHSFGLSGLANALRRGQIDDDIVGMAVATACMFVATAAMTVAFAAARVPRVWGLLATIPFVLSVLIFASVASSGRQRPWTIATLVIEYTYLYALPAIFSVSVLCLIGGWLFRRRTPLGRTISAWPQFAIPISAARFGVLRGNFWRAVLRHAARFTATTVFLGLSFVGAIFIVGWIFHNVLVAYALMSPLTQLTDDFVPIWVFSGIVFWSVVCLLGIIGAYRVRTTRVADLAIACLAATAVWQLSADAVHRIVLLQDQGNVAPISFLISEDELEFLNGLALVWLFRAVLSTAFTRAYSDVKRTSARTARELSALRPERPILFLRSFTDDEQVVTSSNAYFAYAFGASRETLRLEEIVAEIMFARGPLVALANPEIKTAPIGAARDLSSHADWQANVLAYLDRSQAIICFFGRTTSFLWEIDQIIDLGKLHQTLFVLPPTYPADRQLIHDAPRLAGLLGIRDEADERRRLADVRVIAFNRAANSFEAVRSSSSDSFAYREALLRGASLIWTRAAHP